MAELTGLNSLDAAIAAFLAEGWYDEGGVSVEHGWLTEDDWNDGVYVPFERFRDPAAADGLCHSLNGQAARFLEGKGFDAYSSEDGLPDGLDYDYARYAGQGSHPAYPLHPDQLGYHDRTIAAAPNHVVCFVQADGQVFALDFACAQYGYAELPLVLRYDRQGGFARTW